MKSNFTSTRNTQNLVFSPALNWLMHFISSYLFVYLCRCNSLPVSHSTATQKGRESYIMVVKSSPPSEVNVVSLYQRNVPASKEQFKVSTLKIWTLQPQPLFSITAPFNCLCPPPSPASLLSSRWRLLLLGSVCGCKALIEPSVSWQIAERAAL